MHELNKPMESGELVILRVFIKRWPNRGLLDADAVAERLEKLLSNNGYFEPFVEVASDSPAETE